ncbi:MAG TPA: ABC transporter substrate-binding protein [Acidimicrobiales bacterium]|nr:ABC transporter substrate-binding protein [Acidimicrobiales bacterium]
MGRGGRNLWRAWGLALLLCATSLTACGGDRPAALSAPQRKQTVAFLRAVDSGRPANQAAFLDELASAGYEKDRNLVLVGEELAVVYPDEASATAVVQQWVEDDVDLIVALSTVGAAAAAKAAPDIPIAFLVNDPVASGLVAEERSPEGQLTGVTFRVPADRTLDLARRAVPHAESFGVIYPPADPAVGPLLESATDAAATLGLTLVSAGFTGKDDIGSAVTSLRDQGAGMVWALNSPTTFRFFNEIAAAATTAALPMLTNSASDAALLTLQPDTEELYRQLGRQVARILGGTPVSEVPVENPSKFLVSVNLKAADAAGISLPADLVDQADTVVR